MVIGNFIILFDCMFRCFKFVKYLMVFGKDFRILLEIFKIIRLFNLLIELGKVFKWYFVLNWLMIVILVKVKIYV